MSIPVAAVKSPAAPNGAATFKEFALRVRVCKNFENQLEVFTWHPVLETNGYCVYLFTAF